MKEKIKIFKKSEATCVRAKSWYKYVEKWDV
jgi:hypothetical protein